MKGYWSKVDVSGDCWIWTGYKDKDGYGRCGFKGKISGAHKVTYEAAFGSLPSNLEIDHICRNRACVNPDHLRAISHYENTMAGTSFAVHNAAKTHCKSGHEFDALNTYTRSDGTRDCRKCICARGSKYRSNLKNKLEAA